jgi:hypothetical protein
LIVLLLTQHCILLKPFPELLTLLVLLDQEGDFRCHCANLCLQLLVVDFLDGDFLTLIRQALVQSFIFHLQTLDVQIGLSE